MHKLLLLFFPFFVTSSFAQDDIVPLDSISVTISPNKCIRWFDIIYNIKKVDGIPIVRRKYTKVDSMQFFKNSYCDSLSPIFQKEILLFKSEGIELDTWYLQNELSDCGGEQFFPRCIEAKINLTCEELKYALSIADLERALQVILQWSSGYRGQDEYELIVTEHRNGIATSQSWYGDTDAEVILIYYINKYLE